MKINIKKLAAILMIFCFAFSCKDKIVDIKSPCVSLEDGPCGPKKSINDWWLKSSKKS